MMGEERRIMCLPLVEAHIDEGESELAVGHEGQQPVANQGG